MRAAQIALTGVVGVACAVLYVWLGRSKQKGTRNEHHRTSKGDDAPSSPPEAAQLTSGDTAQCDAPPPPADPWEEAMRAKDRGNKRFTGRQYELAVKDYTTAIELAPDLADARCAPFYANRAACLSLLDDFAGCARDCDAALAIDPKYVKALTRRGTAREKLGDLEGAALDLTASCILSRNDNQATLQSADRVVRLIGQQDAARIAAEGCKRPLTPQTVRPFMEEFIAHRELLAPAGGRQTAAEAEARRKKCDRDSRPAQYAALMEEEAVALMGEDRYEDALEAWEAAIEAWNAVYPAPPPGGGDARRAHNIAGTLRHLRGDLKEALAHYDKAVALDGEDSNVLLKRACLNLELGETQMSRADFAAAEGAATGGVLADVLCHRGRTRLMTHDFSAALADTRKSIEIDGTNEVCYIQLAMCLERLQRPAEAKEAMAAAERTFPQSGTMRAYHGELLLMIGDPQGALDKFSEAIEMSGDTLGRPYAGKANALLMLSSGAAVDQATELCEKGRQIEPYCDTILMELAKLRWQQVRMAEVVELLDTVIMLLKGGEEIAFACNMRVAAKLQAKLLETQRDIFEPALKEAARGMQ